MAFEMHDISGLIEEVGRELRTMVSIPALKSRIGPAKLFINTEALGAVILDDHLMGHRATGLHNAVFLYETVTFYYVETAFW